MRRRLVSNSGRSFRDSPCRLNFASIVVPVVIRPIKSFKAIANGFSSNASGRRACTDRLASRKPSRASSPARSKWSEALTFFSLGKSAFGGLQLRDNTSETLRKRIVDVASHAIALGHQIRLAILRGETGQLQRKHGLMSE